MDLRDIRPARQAPASVSATHRGVLIVPLIGLPGAGKSTVARALESELRLRRVCRDAIRHAMFPRCDYSFVEKRAAFRTLLLTLEINCLLGESSVIDGMTFSRGEDYDAVASLAEAHGYDILPLHIDCPPALARERIAHDVAGRSHVAADRDPWLVDQVARRFDPPPAAAIRIDASRSLEDVSRLAIFEVGARLERRRAAT